MWADHSDMKPQGWENNGFCQKIQALHTIIVQEMNVLHDEVFLNYLAKHATQFLWIISHFNYDKLSVLKKASKHHMEATHQGIQGQSSLELTRWLVSCMSTDQHMALQLVEKSGAEAIDDTEQNIIRQWTVLTKLDMHWEAHRSVLKDFQHFLLKLRMKLLTDFDQKMMKQWK